MALSPQLAKDIEQAGYGAIWIGGSPAGDLHIAEDLLAATERIAVATGIVNIWSDDARTVAAAHHRVRDRFPGRFLLGVGVGHPERSSDYTRPYRALEAYLDVLDAEGVPAQERVLAALGPKVLELAKARSAGAHPYLTTSEHTRRAREQLGPDVLLAPEQKVLLEPDPTVGRRVGRDLGRVSDRLTRQNYVNNLMRLGFGAEDLADGGSDSLVDALVGHGDAPAAVGAVRRHIEAGADHVAIQLLTPHGVDPLPGYRCVAEALMA